MFTEFQVCAAIGKDHRISQQNCRRIHPAWRFVIIFIHIGSQHRLQVSPVKIIGIDHIDQAAKIILAPDFGIEKIHRCLGNIILRELVNSIHDQQNIQFFIHFI